VLGDTAMGRFLGGLLGIAAAMGCFAATSGAFAQTVQLTAELNGRNEVPPLQSSGTGNLAATYNPETRTLSWLINYTGLPGLPIAMHFHGPADTSRNAGIAVPVTGNLASPIRGFATLTESQAANLLAGLYYLNLHTIAHPAGELRGQVLVVAAPGSDKQAEQPKQDPSAVTSPDKAAQDSAAARAADERAALDAARAAAEKAARDAAAAKAAAEKAAAEQVAREAAAKAAAENAAREAAAAKAAAEKVARDAAAKAAADKAAAEKIARDLAAKAAADKAAAEKTARDLAAKAAAEKAAAERAAREPSQKAASAPLDAGACQTALDRLTAKEAVAFQSGSTSISNASLSLLNRVKAVLLECQATRIEIGGHTDSFGSERINQPLSERRAQAVVDFMIKGGIPQDRLGAVGFGSTKPIASNANAGGRARNRRIEFTIK
jgi:outer membrane protein OmpA-like peptidoglycan-associated protein